MGAGMAALIYLYLILGKAIYLTVVHRISEPRKFLIM
jgi:hypothetical protein